MANYTPCKNKKTFVARCPIVTVLGHVDHGKTTLLDTIRKTNLAAREYGGITQHIGAYQVTVNPKGERSSRASETQQGIPSRSSQEIFRQDFDGEPFGSESFDSELRTVELLRAELLSRTAQDDLVSQGHKITFIDTPGHEAFGKMRSRGAEVADIAILVVAGNDGVMPQTLESINHIRSAKIPCIVAINKIDLPTVNIDKIKKQLVKAGLQLEEFGGDTPVVPLSAKNGEGVNKLLEMILLIAELYQVKEDDPGQLKGVVIESSLSTNRGPLATVVVRSGILHLRDEIICEEQEFRVRSLTDFLGRNLTIVSSGEAAEVLGWKVAPAVGSILFSKQQLQLSPKSKKEITQPAKSPPLQIPSKTPTLEKEKLKLVIKADTNGTLEAILGSLSGKALVVTSGVGTITESDILFAKAIDAVIIGFNMKVDTSVVKLAETEKVIIKTYNLIYELIQEIEEVSKAKSEDKLENISGEAKILAIFDIRDQKIAGVKVVKGRLARDDQVKVIREEKEIGRARIKSLRHGKEDITSAAQGKEAGVLLSSKIEFLTGDSIISIG